MVVFNQVPCQKLLHKVPAPGRLGGAHDNGSDRAGLGWAGGCVLNSGVLGLLAIRECTQASLLLCFYCIGLITCFAFCNTRSEKNSI